jgi:DNA-directed RNA polymerase specialized sigma24 family protein
VADTEVPERHERSAESVAFDRVSIDDVAQRLGQLTVDQREVIALRLIHDLSLKDVAEIVDRPITAVKASQRRGLRSLQRHILDEGVS